MAARVALLALLLSVLAAALPRPVAAAAEEAFLVVQKSAATRRFKNGEEITVSFRVHNAGTITAYDVALTDNNWPSDIFDIEGNTTATWPKLEVGAPPLQHSLLLRPKVKGPFVTAPAIVKYRVASKSELQTAISTPVPELDVLSDKPAASPFLWIKDLLIKFGPLLSCSFIVIMFVIVVTTPTKPKKQSRSSKKRR